ncbi:uncharacterized protein LOC132623395 [Lycium barbarum]|uniref:uncharacterized protein LOC132623395 n=1 Tax=Lycium barbarum TaxID=112863 RepID=UPI00293F139D|nr:uncharacterized protein LOC132623395 [Lycium barbarum]
MKMVLLTPPPTPAPAPATTGISSNGFYVTLIGSMHSLLALWKKKPNSRGTTTKKLGDNSSLAKPKKFLAKISNIKARNRKKAKNEEEKEVEDDEEFGDEGLWQREILMGDKCQPLDFSGVIYYDRYGKRLPEVPIKSPRASPLPSYLYASSKYADLK